MSECIVYKHSHNTKRSPSLALMHRHICCHSLQLLLCQAFSLLILDKFKATESMHILSATVSVCQFSDFAFLLGGLCFQSPLLYFLFRGCSPQNGWLVCCLFGWLFHLGDSVLCQTIVPAHKRETDNFYSLRSSSVIQLCFFIYHNLNAFRHGKVLKTSCERSAGQHNFATHKAIQKGYSCFLYCRKCTIPIE